MEHVRKLFDLLEPRGRRGLLGLLAVTATGSLLEAVGIGLVLPYLEVVTAPWEVFADDRFAPLLARLGISSWNGLVLAASVALVAVFVAKNAFIAYQWRLVYGFLYDQSVELSRRLLRGYLRVPYTFHLQKNTGELIRNTTSEPRRAMDGAVRSVLEFLAEAFVIVGLAAVLLVAHTLAAAAVLTLLAVLGWGLTAAFRKRLKREGRIRVENESRILQAVGEALGGVKEVKLLGREGHFLDRFEDSARPLADALRQEAVVRKYPRLMLETGAVAAMVALAAIVVFTAAEVRTALPVVGVFGVATVRLMPSLKRVVDNVNKLRYQVPAIDVLHEQARRIERFEDGEDGAGDEPPVRFTDRLEVRDLTYAYPGTEEASLRGVSLVVRRGESVGVVGRSGSGKTTLVNLVLGLLEPQEGRITVDGRDVRENLSSWQRQVGYIPQEVYLTDDTLARNVAFGLPEEEVDRERVWWALEGAQLAEFARRQANGIDTVVGERGVRISGGQRQRVAIARALYHDPELLVLDEATSSLDYRTEAEVMSAVEALAGEKTLVVVTHRLRTVEGCDEVHLLEEGRLAASGSSEQLRERSSRFRRLALEE